MTDDKLWLDGWEHAPYGNLKKVALVSKKHNDLSPIVIWHQVSGVFAEAATLDRFAHNTNKPICLWYADPDTTAWEYEMLNKWDGIRKTDSSGNPIRARKGYESKKQTLPFNRISWGCKSAGGRANFRGKLNIQIEDMGYSSDSPYMTEDELYRRGLVLKDIGIGIMRYLDEDWIPQAYVDVGLPYPKSYGRKNGQRIPIPEFMTNMGGRNVLQHALIPKNKHGDCGAMNFGKICGIARHELNQPSEKVLAGAIQVIEKPASKVVVSRVVAAAAAAGTTTDRLATAQNYLGKAQYELQQLKKETSK